MEKEKLEKIKNIKKIKAKKRTTCVIIAIIILIFICIGLYIGDKNAQIFDGKIASIFEKEDKKQNEKDTKNTKDNKENKDDEKEKNNAAKVAIKKFEELGEKTKKSELEIIRIQRDGELYYYISSKENTVEVRIKDNKITRVNSIPVK